MEPRGNLIELRMLLKYDLTKVKNLLGRCSTWFQIYLCEHKFTSFYLKKNKILRVHVKDKSCNSPEGLQLYYKDSNTGVLL